MCQICTESIALLTTWGFLFSIWCALKHKCMACALGFHKWIKSNDILKKCKCCKFKKEI